MKETDIVFNSKENSGESFQIASGYISKTAMFFENEGVVAVIEAKGSVEFYNTADELLAKGDVTENSGGREVYEEVFASVDDRAITLKFPIYEWIDNYPNCDGEHDRWDSRKIGENVLIFDYKENKIK